MWQDVDRVTRPVDGLDYYLDNKLAAVPELALCMHSKGVVRGYQLMATEAIPARLAPHPGTLLFSPEIVERNAATILQASAACPFCPPDLSLPARGSPARSRSSSRATPPSPPSRLPTAFPAPPRPPTRGPSVPPREVHA